MLPNVSPSERHFASYAMIYRQYM